VPSRRRLAGIALCVIALDQVSKSWAESALDNGHIINVVGSLRFALGYNSGIAFSQGQGLGPVVGIVALIAVSLLVRAMVKASSALSAYALCAIVAGAIGNVVDRLVRGDGWLHGRVVDFIDVQWWPVFNVADSSISIGACLLILALVRESRQLSGPEVHSES
jgi:signal peptidase II